MKAKYNIITFLLLIFFFPACEREVDFSGAQTDPLLVLNAFLTPDSLMSVHLTESVFFLNDNSRFKRVNDASVKLTINDQEPEELTLIGKGKYVSSRKPEAGDKISISVEHPVLPDVSCSGKMPVKPLINSVDFSDIRIEKTITGIMTEKINGKVVNSDTTFTNKVIGVMNVTFSDPVDDVNFYRLATYVRTYFPDDTYSDRVLYFSPDDPVFAGGVMSDPFEMSYSYSYGEFSDELFDGKKYTLKANVTLGEYEENSSGQPGGGDDMYYKSGSLEYAVDQVRMDLHVELQGITGDYFYYLRSRGLSEANMMGNLFSEPVQIYNNIKGGIGILGNYTTSSHTQSYLALLYSSHLPY